MHGLRGGQYMPKVAKHPSDAVQEHRVRLAEYAFVGSLTQSGRYQRDRVCTLIKFITKPFSMPLGAWMIEAQFRIGL